MSDCLCTAIDAWADAQKYAATIGFSMPPVSAEDIRTVANTLFINRSEQRGGRR